MEPGTRWQEGADGVLAALARAFTRAPGRSLDAVVRRLDGWETLPVRPDVLEVLATALPHAPVASLGAMQRCWFAPPGEATHWNAGVSLPSEIEAVLARGAVELALARLHRPARRCRLLQQAGWQAAEAWVATTDREATLWLFVPAHAAAPGSSGPEHDDAAPAGRPADDGRLRGDLAVHAVRDREPAPTDPPGAPATGAVRAITRIAWVRHLERARGLSRAAAHRRGPDAGEHRPVGGDGTRTGRRVAPPAGVVD